MTMKFNRKFVHPIHYRFNRREVCVLLFGDGGLGDRGDAPVCVPPKNKKTLLLLHRRRLRGGDHPHGQTLGATPQVTPTEI